jgi:CheY-like chemotaxis protein
VKVAILIKTVVGLALEKVIGVCGEIEFIENPNEANLIVAQKASEIVNIFCAEKEFILFIDPREQQSQTAANVHVFNTLQVAELMNLVVTLAAKEFAASAVRSNRRIVNSGAQRVLVIDDTLRHQESAMQTLSSCDLTVAEGYDEALRLLSSNQYDVVLTDLEMPAGTEGALAQHTLGATYPLGLLIANEAARCGAKAVAVVTDLNHHADPFSAAFDHFSRQTFQINGAKVCYMHAPMMKIDDNTEYAKNWKEALDRLLS